MNKIATFGLLTDFGFDFAVSSMKALLTREVPAVNLIDIDHNIAKFSIASAAFVISKVHLYFPKDSIFLCIVDPGVGTQREALCVELENGFTFFGPNNGIFHYILQNNRGKTFTIDDSLIQPASYTFHGRDLFVPAAARFALGIKDFLIPYNKPIHPLLQNNQDFIAYIDSFGNIKTTIEADSITPEASFLNIKLHEKNYKIPFVKTFGEIDKGALLCYRGSNNTLELAVNLGSAQKYLNAHVGDNISLITTTHASSSKGTL
jgi:S-adenosyl-L-methionine hydrolase (adenosine-forming)